jgi:tRNA threonylcarbamoyladenosine biosynthesis protein TsaE
MEEIIIETNSPEETFNAGKALGEKVKPGDIYLLNGDLGVGKTTFVRGLAKGLNIKDVVQSPTFNIMKVYFKADRPLIHIDAYRLSDNNVDIGLDEYIGYESGITVIEWPQFILDLIPDNKISVSIFKMDNENDRKIIIEGEY